MVGQFQRQFKLLSVSSGEALKPPTRGYLVRIGGTNPNNREIGRPNTRASYEFVGVLVRPMPASARQLGRRPDHASYRNAMYRPR